MTQDRLIVVDGTLNLRDLGGYRSRMGRSTRWRTLFRSDDIAHVTDRGLAALGSLELRLICDLRDTKARERRPQGVAGRLGARVAAFPMEGPAAMSEFTAFLSKSRDREFWIGFMTDMYRTMVEDSGATFAEVITLLADASSLPALFHCTGGKDRTGVLAAIMLSCLGVDRETILRDYELTTTCSSLQTIERLRAGWEADGVALDAVMPLLTAPRFALQAALDRIDEEFGSVENYLVAHGAAVTAAAALRRALLTP